MNEPVSLTTDQMRILEVLAKSEGRTVEDLVRSSVDQYLDTRKHSRAAIEDAAFGAWGEGEDGLAYQERLRKEW